MGVRGVSPGPKPERQEQSLLQPSPPPTLHRSAGHTAGSLRAESCSVTGLLPQSPCQAACHLHHDLANRFCLSLLYSMKKYLKHTEETGQC